MFSSITVDIHKGTILNEIPFRLNAALNQGWTKCVNGRDRREDRPSYLYEHGTTASTFQLWHTSVLFWSSKNSRPQSAHEPYFYT